MKTTTLDTPAGPFTIVATGTGVVRAAGFTRDVDALLALLPGQWREKPEPVADLGGITQAVADYFAGDVTAPDRVPVEQCPPGTDGFLPVAWEALRTVPPGAPVSYTALAALAGRPAAVRPAATACARNAAALFVPCHRVVRTDGALGGYRWGVAVKRWLLDHERRAVRG